MSCVKIIFILLCLSQVNFSRQRSSEDDDFYVAAVVEYNVINNVPTNLRNYAGLIKDASKQGADIIVFPELTLSRGKSVVVPIHGILKDNPVPCLRPDLYDEVLVTISSAARQNAIYVVVNFEELVNCTVPTSEKCPEKKVCLFNTNVVFDRNGAVIDRYRKINLFGEYTRTPALHPDLGKFSTDFGVTFGHFICFDLMFQIPAVQLVQKYNLTDIIFPTMWFSEMPYLTAIQIQEAFAFAMNVNFLGAGANNIEVGSSGSGIYSGKAGALVSIMSGVSTTRLLVAKVPKTPGKINGPISGPIYDDPKDQDNLKLIKDPSLPSHLSKLLIPGYQEITLKDKDVTCNFKVHLKQTTNGTSSYFRAFVQDGSNIYAKRAISVAACLIVACKDNNAKSCPYRYLRRISRSVVMYDSSWRVDHKDVAKLPESPYRAFTKLYLPDMISTRYTKEEENVEIVELEIQMITYKEHYNTSLHCSDIVYYPVSLTNKKYPLDPKNFTLSETKKPSHGASGRPLKQNSYKNLTFKLISPQIELVSFGIWGRIFNRDGRPVLATQKDIDSYIELEEMIYNNRVNKVL